jgi:hypothetical protein
MAEPNAVASTWQLLRPRIGFTVIGILLVVIAAVLPLAIGSAVGDFAQAQSDLRYSITPSGTAHAATYNRLRLRVTGLDEWAGQATIQVSGAHICNPTCDHDAKFLFVSVPLLNARQEDGLPPAQSVTYPPDAVESSADIKLPVSGSSILYPFDRYRLRLGVVMVRVFSDKSTQILTPQDAAGHLFLTLRTHVARLDMDQPLTVDPASVRPNASPYQYLYVEDLTFERPLYLKVLTVLLVVLVAAAAAYAVFLRPFDQLVLNSGALVLGVWGIRAILLGTGVPGITAVDLALSMLILFMLVAITVRAMQYLARAGQVRLTPWRHRVPPEQPLEATPAEPGVEPHSGRP